MSNQKCICCKIVGIVAIIAALNWGMIGIANFNFIEHFFGMGMLTRLIYIAFGLSGLALLSSFFMNCPMCKKE
jgi:uncharacterized membrane protein YuzA (DUF378 family)